MNDSRDLKETSVLWKYLGLLECFIDLERALGGPNCWKLIFILLLVITAYVSTVY